MSPHKYCTFLDDFWPVEKAHGVLQASTHTHIYYAIHQPGKLINEKYGDDTYFMELFAKKDAGRVHPKL